MIAAWGYEADAVAGLAVFAPPPVPIRARPGAGGGDGQRAFAVMLSRASCLGAVG